MKRALRILAVLFAALFFATAAANLIIGLVTIPRNPDVIEAIAYPVNFLWSLLFAAPGFFLWTWATRKEHNPK